MSGHALQIVRMVASWVALAIIFGAVIFYSVKKSEDPARMVFKWVLTAIVVAFMRWHILPAMGRGGFFAVDALFLTLVCGLIMTATWRRDLASLVANPLGSLYDGGDTPPEAKPAYSVAQARQKQGKYVEAIAEIRQQLARFPTDFEGHMLLAQIQAEDLKDLPGAELTIQHLCAQPGHAPANVAFAYYSLADWHLKYGPDRDAARRALEQVGVLLPETEFALTAAHRIAHLGSSEMLLAPHERKKFILTQGARNIGLLQNQQPVKPAETDPAQAAADSVRHLEAHPLDTEVREHLAAIYADHYGRLDLATDQLEQLIQMPHQPPKLVVRWLNLLADLQVRSGADYDTVRQTLQRVLDLYPTLALGEQARNRLALLKLEFKAHEAKVPVKLGSYEQNIGLRQGPVRGK